MYYIKCSVLILRLCSSILLSDAPVPIPSPLFGRVLIKKYLFVIFFSVYSEKGSTSFRYGTIFFRYLFLLYVRYLLIPLYSYTLLLGQKIRFPF